MALHRFLSLIPAALGILFVAAPARADEPTPNDLPRLSVSVTGPVDGVLQQSSDEGQTWQRVCELPCVGIVVAPPHARHRIIDGAKRYPIFLRGGDGEHIDIHVGSGSEAARRNLMVAAAVVGGIGVTLAGWGVGILVGQAGAGSGESCRGNDACLRSQAEVEDKRREGQTLAAVGGGAILAGAALLILGFAVGRADTSVARAASLSGRNAVPIRTPEWTMQSATKPVHLHAHVLDLQF